MTLDEAIAHCLEVAEKKEDEINNKPHLFDSQQEMDDCARCAAEHLRPRHSDNGMRQFPEA